ncbi:hypothetical protein BT96DRAFT_832549 [Gymnopus androsaceus JB14]|uniref:Uncharacterized protein n=1 Tax=Gymnopus androsaceus JB14 TaxID=1447944 RepID=A0A6A4GYS5_9AGAR|nr:hypothetical protein BT96DRAFT_832549 [Gymnopus androsaceus JB14]
MEDVQNWKALVEAWFQLEEAKGFQEVGQGKGLPTKDHPKAVGTWIGLGRTKVTPTNEGQTLRTELLHWWKTFNPSWHQTSFTGEFLQSGEGDWGILDMSGRNGLLSVIACMNWWLDLELDEDSQWLSLLKDVQWVLECLLKEAEEPPWKKSQSDCL